MINPILFFDTVATSSPKLLREMPIPNARISLATATSISNPFSGQGLGDIIQGFIKLAGKSDPNRTFLIIQKEQANLAPNTSILRIAVKNVKGYMAKLAAKVNTATNEVVIGGKIKGIRNYETGAVGAHSMTFQRLADIMGIEPEAAQRMSAKAQSMGIDVRTIDNMKKVLAGEFEKTYNPHLVAEAKGNLGLGNAAGRFNKRFRSANKPVLMMK